jgi:hypothetical protein
MRRRRLLLASVLVVTGAVAGTAIALRSPSGPSMPTARAGTVVGGIVPGGAHPPGIYAGGTVTALGPGGRVVETARVQEGHLFRLQLSSGSYDLKARYVDEPCSRHVVVEPHITRRFDVICAAK